MDLTINLRWEDLERFGAIGHSINANFAEVLEVALNNVPSELERRTGARKLGRRVIAGPQKPAFGKAASG